MKTSIGVLLLVLLSTGCSAETAAGDEQRLGTAAGAASCKQCTPSGAVTFFVDASASAGGANGTAKRPFRTIASALAAATKANVESVTLQLADGSYAGDHLLDRPTFFRGTTREGTVLHGSIVTVGKAVGVEHMTIAPSAAGRTAIRSWPMQGPLKEWIGGATIVSDVAIANASPYGIDQVKGTLDARDLLIVDTSMFDTSTGAVGQAGDGAAVHVAGARASLSEVHLDRNAQGVIADGAGTFVTATRLFVFNSRGVAVPAGRPMPAAINVVNAAHLQAHDFYVFNAIGNGVKVESGSRARLEYGRVEHVVAMPSAAAGSDVVTNAGWAALVGAYANSEVHVFVTDLIESDVVGLQIDATSRATLETFPNIWADELCAPPGTPYCGRIFAVSHCPVGTNLQNPTYASACVTNYGYYDNGANLATATLPLPPVPPSSDGTTTPPAAATCASVPWQ